MGANRVGRVGGALVTAMALVGAGLAGELTDAEVVAVKYVKKSRPSDELIGRIETMLAKARAQVARLGSVHPGFDWVAGEMVLEFSPGKLPRVGDGKATGIPELDKVLAQFGVRSLEPAGLAGPTWFRARLDPRVNMEAVASTFEEVPYVKSAGPDRLIGNGGNEVWLAEDGTGYALSFVIGWGDCPAGCTENHRWTFHFSEELELGEVEEEGDPLPEAAESPRDTLPGRRPPRGGVETRN